MYKLCRKLLFLLEPEFSHRLTCKVLMLIHKLHLDFIFGKVINNPKKIMGINFPNPLGLAAGFDKNALYTSAMGMLGFGFIEVGTVTPSAQIGNPKPRLFRLESEHALINRLGFNNDGVDKVCERIRQGNFKGVLGISITKNNMTDYEHAVNDYLLCLRKVYADADYIALDLSCPNVPNFKEFLAGENFNAILFAAKQEQKKLAEMHKQYKPIAVKISPDLDETTIASVAEKINEYQMDAVIACNTSTSRPINHPLAQERGGLSGVPLFPLVLKTITCLKQHLNSHIPIIAVGGIDSVEKAQQLRNAGADLLQIYTGLIYQGPRLVHELAKL